MLFTTMVSAPPHTPSPLFTIPAIVLEYLLPGGGGGVGAFIVVLSVTSVKE